MSCVKLANEHKSRPRTKHFAIRLHHFRSYVVNKQITVEHISTKDQLADIFTKPLPKTQFNILRDKLMGWWSSQSCSITREWENNVDFPILLWGEKWSWKLRTDPITVHLWLNHWHTKLFVIHNITSLHTKSRYYAQYHIIACNITETIPLLQITVVTHYVHNLIVKSEIANKQTVWNS